MQNSKTKYALEEIIIQGNERGEGMADRRVVLKESFIDYWAKTKLKPEEEEWLLQNYEVLFEYDSPQRAQSCMEHLRSKGYHCKIWNKKDIHIFEKHLQKTLLGVYAAIESMEDVCSICHTKGGRYSGEHYYCAQIMHPLHISLKPVDVIDMLEIEKYPDGTKSAKLMADVVLYGADDWNKQLKRNPQLVVLARNSVVCCLFDRNRDLRKAQKALKKALYSLDRTAYKKYCMRIDKPCFEFGNVSGSCLILPNHILSKKAICLPTTGKVYIGQFRSYEHMYQAQPKIPSHVHQ